MDVTIIECGGRSDVPLYEKQEQWPAAIGELSLNREVCNEIRIALNITC